MTMIDDTCRLISRFYLYLHLQLTVVVCCTVDPGYYSFVTVQAKSVTMRTVLFEDHLQINRALLTCLFWDISMLEQIILCKVCFLF